MITINGRHIKNAIVERRRMNRRKPPFADDGTLIPFSPGDHVWTVSAMLRAADLAINLSSRFRLSHAGRIGRCAVST
jgi:hypothetical protein